jgi:hypothetical protein
MRWLHALRLLLDVLGALFLGLITVAPALFGVFPYEGLKRLGTIPFYGLLAAAIAVWAWLVARRAVAHAGARSTSSRQRAND